jgi:phosphotransferase system HPr-like phosphotransfer protein
VQITEQQKTAKGYRFKVTITLPANTVGMNSFKDAVLLKINDGRHIEIDCTGFYAEQKNKVESLSK